MVQFLPQAPTKRSHMAEFLHAVRESIPQAKQEYQMMKKEAEAKEIAKQRAAALRAEFGENAEYLPESVLNVREKAKHPTPEKQLTPLQQSQKALADARLEALNEERETFKNVFGGGKSPITESKQEIQPEVGAVTQPEEDLETQAAFAGQPGKRGILGTAAKMKKEKKEKQSEANARKQGEYFKVNEPEIMKMANTSRNLQLEEARYDRLGQLFSEPENFPSSFNAALFSKDGHLNDIVYSQMTPEAQESVKLIIDSTSGIKDTYGSRVTNFDLQTYLKKLPSLLNSPEGKMRVLRDLQIMNKLNQMHANGIMEVFDEAGGTDKIPFSKAEKLYREKYGDQEKQLLKQFVNPEKATFNEMPNAQEYLGKKIKDEETGEIYISDGNEWKLYQPQGR